MRELCWMLHGETCTELKLATKRYDDVMTNTSKPMAIHTVKCTETETAPLEEGTISFKGSQHSHHETQETQETQDTQGTDTMESTYVIQLQAPPSIESVVEEEPPVHVASVPVLDVANSVHSVHSLLSGESVQSPNAQILEQWYNGNSNEGLQTPDDENIGGAPTRKKGKRGSIVIDMENEPLSQTVPVSVPTSPTSVPYTPQSTHL